MKHTRHEKSLTRHEKSLIRVNSKLYASIGVDIPLIKLDRPPLHETMIIKPDLHIKECPSICNAKIDEIQLRDLSEAINDDPTKSVNRPSLPDGQSYNKEEICCARKTMV